jgi:hypothetical protein
MNTENCAEADRGRSERIDTELKIGDAIWNRLLATGMQSPPTALGAHLPEIYTARDQYAEMIELFLSEDVRDRENIGDVLVGISVEILQHTSWCINDTKRALDEVIGFCNGVVQANRLSTKQVVDGRSRKRARLANDISNKVIALGMRRPALRVGEELSDLYIALGDYRRLIDKFLSTDSGDLKAVGKILADIKLVLQVMHYHIRKAKRPLERVIDYCYVET